MTLITSANTISVFGYAYPSWYISPLSTEDADQKVGYLQRIKGVKHVYIVIDRPDRTRYVASDVNLLTQDYANLVGKFVSEMDANVTLYLQHSGNSLSSERLFDHIEDDEDGYWVFKELLQGIGYAYQFSVWNNSDGAFKLTQADIETKLKGKRYLSGST
jgi:hypothetical protein